MNDLEEIALWHVVHHCTLIQAISREMPLHATAYVILRTAIIDRLLGRSATSPPLCEWVIWLTPPADGEAS